METLQTIVYFSRSKIDYDRSSCVRAIDAILRKARTNNTRGGITGALLFDEVYFAQFLKGPEDAVTAMFDKIRRDPRHTEVTVLSRQTAHSRRFAGWAMGYAGASADMLPTLWSDLISSNEPILQGERAGRKIVEFLTSIISYDEARQAMAEAPLT